MGHFYCRGTHLQLKQVPYLESNFNTEVHFNDVVSIAHTLMPSYGFLNSSDGNARNLPFESHYFCTVFHQHAFHNGLGTPALCLDSIYFVSRNFWLAISSICDAQPAWSLPSLSPPSSASPLPVPALYPPKHPFYCQETYCRSHFFLDCFINFFALIGTWRTQCHPSLLE